MAIRGVFLGCPIWGNRDWVGELFTRDAQPADYLAQYASVFNTVEGNTTFYGIPSPESVARWREATPPTFRFCFKFPRTISHELRLVGAEAESERFLARLEPLGERLGPFFLQLPASFGPPALPALARYLDGLPDRYGYAVEVRHPDFFDAGPHERALDALLAARGVDRVSFDVRALRAATGDSPEIRAALRRKPDVPHRRFATGPHPFVRYIADPRVEANHDLLEEWARVVAGWIEAGRTPFFFLHSPDDFYAPRLARLFFTRLAARASVGALPPWPAEQEPPEAEQLSLF